MTGERFAGRFAVVPFDSEATGYTLKIWVEPKRLGGVTGPCNLLIAAKNVRRG